jgi:hypothetical protein
MYNVKFSYQEVPQDRFAVLHFHMDYEQPISRNDDGTLWPAVRAIVMFHGQDLRRFTRTSTGSHQDWRVYGQNRETTNVRTQLFRCNDNEEAWYPGWAEITPDMEPFERSLETLGHFIRAENILSAQTFLGLYDGHDMRWVEGERERASFIPGGDLYVPDPHLTVPNPIGNEDMPDDGV